MGENYTVVFCKFMQGKGCLVDHANSAIHQHVSVYRGLLQLPAEFIENAIAVRWLVPD